MRKNFGVLLVLALLAGCAGAQKSGAPAAEPQSPRVESGSGTPPAFALPGVPLKSDLEAEIAAKAQPEAAVTPPAEASPAATPAETAPATGNDLEFHLGAAKRYAARRQYRSAAAEYGAALPFLPAGDARAVYLLERQGAMVLRTGSAAKAGEHFLSAIAKAKELNASGNDLANSHLGLGYCLEKAKDIPGAIANYEKALELSGSAKVKARIAETISDLKKLPAK
jgi:tetratricopeptide (TPR) repeat protein